MKQNNIFFTYLFFALFLPIFSFGQEKTPSIQIKKTDEIIKIDGKLDEQTWRSAPKSSRFWQSSPFDTAYTAVMTELAVSFDETNFYVAAKCFQKKEAYVVQSLKRDFGPGTTDLFAVLLDTYGDGQNAFSFSVSPLGVQREGLIVNGNEFSTDWDNRWFSAVTNEPEYYCVEIAIPFKTLRYRQSEEEMPTWGINFLRFDQSQEPAERSTWAFLPRFSNGNNAAFMGKLHWETPPPKPNANIAFIPYVLGGLNRDYLKGKPWDTEGGLGFDAKVAVSSSMNLDLTVNPDFAQVDVDVQQTNLSRFELFFPERRQFFLENSDLFGGFGSRSVIPFFSRRVGLDANGNKIPILAGARLTGKLDNNWRVGLMNVQTGAVAESKTPATNFTAAAIQRKVFARSNVGVIFVNRNEFKSDSVGNNTWALDGQSFNRVLGLDYRLFSADGKWLGKVFYHHAFKPQQSLTRENPFATAAILEYRARDFNARTSFEVIGQGFEAQSGFLQRNDYYRTEPNFNFVFYPRNKRINSWSIGADGDVFWRLSDNKVLDWDFSPVLFSMAFRNNARLTLVPLRINNVFLFNDFDPTRTGGQVLKKGSAYTFERVRGFFQSDTRQPFSYELDVSAGEHFNGNRFNFVATLTYRWQPYGIFSLNVEGNKFSMPDGFNSPTLWLISPRVDLSFNRNVFFTTVMQYNSQINNVNLNARLQWRFAPVSDLFLVYTDNYFAADDFAKGYSAFQPKNSGLVLKCTYWLNL